MTPPAPDRPVAERLLEERAWLQSLARSLVVDQATADDVAQDASLLALTRPPRQPGALRGWLRRVVTNLASNARRSSSRRAARESSAARPDTDDAPADVVVHWELRKQVVDAVLALDEPYRTTILLRFFEELTLEEVAARLDVPPDTVKTRQRRAVEMLRARLAHLDDGAGRRGLAVLLAVSAPERPRGGSVAPGSSKFPAVPAGAAFTAGGVAMSWVAKTLVAAVVLATIGAGWWMVRTGAEREAANATAERSDPSKAAAGAAARAKRPVPASAADDVPATGNAFTDVDLDRDLTGVVVDGAGKAVGGAEVAAFAFDIMSSMLHAMKVGTLGRGPELARTTSSPDGTFKLRLTEGATTLLRATATGFAPVEIPDRGTGEQVRIVLGPPTSLVVRVVDTASAPVGGATVRALGGTVTAGVMGSMVGAHGVTAADGTITFAGLPRGPSLQIDVEPGANRAPTRARHVLQDIDVNEVLVTLTVGRVIEGRVIDADLGVAIAGAGIGTDSQRPPFARTDSDGRFRVESWTGKTGGDVARIVVTAPGFATVLVDPPETTDPATPFEVRLRHGFDVAGVVARADGTPIAGARIVASMARSNAARDRVIADTECAADGTFRVGAFARERTAQVVVHADGFADIVRTVMPPPKGEDRADIGTIVMSAGRTVRGVVTDADGAPLVAQQVEITDATGIESTLPIPRRRTNTAGRFAFPALAPGRYVVRTKSNDARAPKAEATVVVEAGGDPAAVTIVVKDAEDAATVTFPVRARVVDEDGRPVPGVKLSAAYAANSETRATSSDGGVAEFACAFEPMSVSNWLDSGLGARYLTRWTLLRPGQTEFDVVLQRAEPISGTVSDAAGLPVARAWVMAFVGANQVGQGSADEQGRFAIGVPPGATVELQAVRQPEYGKNDPSAAMLTSVAAGTVDVALTIRPVTLNRTVDVTIEGVPTGAKAMLGFHYAGMDRTPRWQQPFDDSMRLRIEELPTAPVTLTVMLVWPTEPAAGSTGLLRIRIDGATTAVRIVVPALRTVRGQVVDAAGLPVADASVFANTGTAASGSRADHDGRFELRVPADAPVPFHVLGNPVPGDMTKPVSGFDLFESDERELRIVVRPVPVR
ncbi:MAG: sigma-70 family RNA polymerase sigma factor [Planctomycetes bacterium]|nr:sigma-70 family RNA polymerase sigma factor [Planctomycetota bacterium]